MQDCFAYSDDLGPSKLIHVWEPSLPLKAILVVDNVAKGPSIGGVRMAEDVSTEECVRLARAMTLKNAAAGLEHGGGKAVLFGDPKMPKERKEHLIRGLAKALLERVQALSRADPHSTGVFLETEDPRNVSFYEHCDYRLTGHAEIGRGLEAWGVFRPDED